MDEERIRDLLVMIEGNIEIKNYKAAEKYTWELLMTLEEKV